MNAYSARRIIYLAAALLLSAAAVHADEDDIVIGVPLPLSGANAVFGHMQKNSYMLALEEINRKGGIGGIPLKLDFRDTGGKPQTAGEIAEHFVKVKGYPMVLGGFSSRETAALAEVCERNGVPYLAVTGSDDVITQKGYRNVFRLAPPISTYPKGVLDFIGGIRELKTAAVLYEGSGFGRNMAAAVKRSAEEYGWEIAFEKEYEYGTRNMGKLLSGLKDVGPDVVFLVSFAGDASSIVRELRTGDMKQTILVGLTPFFTTRAFQKQAGISSEGVMAAVLWSPKLNYVGADRYFDRYLDRFDTEPDYHGAEAFAAATVLAGILRRTDSMDPGSIRDALLTGVTGTVFGDVSFQTWDGFRNQNRPLTFAAQWIGSELQIIWPAEHGTAQPILIEKDDLRDSVPDKISSTL